MKTETRKVHSCDHCKKRYFRPHACLEHENMCFSNPENKRACHDCHHLTTETVEVDNPWHNPYNSETIEVSIFYCSVKDIPLCTPQNEIKGNAFRIDDQEVDPMPKSCKDQKTNQQLMDSTIFG